MLIAIGAMSGLILILTTLLIVASKKLAVAEDPRTDIVEGMLPGANCGACGYIGCRQFAEALVRQETSPAKCTVSSDTERQHIAQFLRVEVGEAVKQVVRIACAGANNVARHHARYSGIKTCQAATLIAGGGKTCSWGCLGYGDCEAACDFNAIVMNEHSLPVVIEANCTACGDCIKACPKDLFSLHPVSHRLWVACKNLEFGDGILDYCEVACTACGRCAMDAKGGLIKMKNNLPVIDYTKDHGTRIPIERCPTGAIIWLEADGTVIKGREAKKIYRQQEMLPQAT
ncbi:MAG TPA: RnfABCDGE type electron transport complex subunit B [Gammaproteobacteria bacterium]